MRGRRCETTKSLSGLLLGAAGQCPCTAAATLHREAAFLLLSFAFLLVAGLGV